jgi:hypothetical protein
MHDRQRDVSITNDAPGGGPGVVVVAPSCTVTVYGHNAVVVLKGGLRTHTELQSSAPHQSMFVPAPLMPHNALPTSHTVVERSDGMFRKSVR